MSMLINVDLDWLNNKTNPVRSLKGILRHLSPTIPAVITIEHHHILKHLRDWIKTGIVTPPFDIIHIDEHHDYYYNAPPHDPEGRRINCGNWGFRLPLWWYNSFTWVQNSSPCLADWDEAINWLVAHNKRVSLRQRLQASTWKPVAATFCVSPDYVDGQTMEYMDRLISIIVQHFGLQHAPRVNPNRHEYVHQIEAWQRVACAA